MRRELRLPGKHPGDDIELDGAGGRALVDVRRALRERADEREGGCPELAARHLAPRTEIDDEHGTVEVRVVERERRAG